MEPLTARLLDFGGPARAEMTHVFCRREIFLANMVRIPFSRKFTNSESQFLSLNEKIGNCKNFIVFLLSSTFLCLYMLNLAILTLNYPIVRVAFRGNSWLEIKDYSVLLQHTNTMYCIIVY